MFDFVRIVLISCYGLISLILVFFRRNEAVLFSVALISAIVCMNAQKLENLLSLEASLTVNYVATPCMILVMIACILLVRLAYGQSVRAGRLRIVAESALERKKAS